MKGEKQAAENFHSYHRIDILTNINSGIIPEEPDTNQIDC